MNSPRIHKLYRGLNAEMFERLGKRAKPKAEGRPFMSIPCAGDDHVQAGSGVEAGMSIRNSVVGHQWKQAGSFPTSGVSSTPKFDRACWYALGGRRFDQGVVLEYDVRILEDLGVDTYRVRDHVPNPAVPQDDEYILVAEGGLAIPEEAITHVWPVGQK